jgi:trimeric autotransporter adhesin
LNAVSPKPTETSVTETTVSTDGLTRSVATDLDSNGTADRINTHTLVNNPDGSRVETTTDTGNNGTLLDKVISTTSANGKTTTTTIDRNGDGLVDLTTLKQMTVNADGSSKIMAANENRNIKHHQKVAA